MSGFLSACVGAYLLSLAFHPALRLPVRARVAALAIVGGGVAAVPWIAPIPGAVGRLAAAIFAGVLVLKMWDLHVGVARGERPTWTETAGFMANAVSLVHRRTEHHPRPARWKSAGRIVRAALVGGGAFAAFLFFVRRVDWTGLPFLVEHAAKATSFFVFGTAFFELLVALVRMLGGSAVTPVDRPLLARTPADFWRRFNRCVGEFLREDVFRLAGGRRHPVRATLVAFAVSAVLHEYIFSVTIGRIEGYQTAFFLIQGCAVALTLRWKPGPVAGTGTTLAFNLVSSILFFASFDAMGGFYADGLPW